MTPTFRALLAAAACSALLPVAALAQEAADDPARTISVTGSGEVAIKPDMATLSVGVRHEAATAREALDKMTAGIGPVLERLIAAGIPDSDIQTGALGLDPIYEYPEYGQPRVTGFAAYTSLTVVVRDVGIVGQVLDAAVSDGANTLGGISFGLADPAQALDLARVQAVADARARAELYAGAAGVELGDVLTLTEAGGYAPQPMYDMRAEMAMASAPVPVAAGEVTVSAQVSVVYEIE